MMIALGFDSFIVSLALGPLLDCRLARVRLALLFGACDALATLLGAAVVGRYVGGWSIGQAAPMSAAAYGLFVLAAASFGRSRLTTRARPRSLLLLPLLMSVDDLAQGAAGGPFTTNLLPHSLLLGVTSGSMALLGLLLGGALVRLGGRSAARYSASGLLLAAAIMLFT
jgi:putative Mn2+ efflux pump MntP